MEPPNNGHVRDEHFVHRSEVVPCLEVMYGQLMAGGKWFVHCCPLIGVSIMGGNILFPMFCLFAFCVYNVSWRFIVHGGIDGFSQLPVFLQCSATNTADKVFEYFLEAVEQYGRPLRVRSDMGGENIRVAEYMWSHQHARIGQGMIMGRSVHKRSLLKHPIVIKPDLKHPCSRIHVVPPTCQDWAGNDYGKISP